MSWAARRRFIIFCIIGLFAAAIFAIFFTSVFYKTPSCTDSVQNEGEAGIDCGGPCPYLCTAEEHAPTILFTKAIPNGAGRTDIAASVENVNATAAAKNVPYSLTLYGAGQVLLQQVTGTVDLPPAATVPIFIPGVSSGNQKVTQAFLTIDPTLPQWYTMINDSRTIPVVSNTTLSGTAIAPRIDAALSNSSVTEIDNVKAIVFVKDAQNEVIAASQTIVPAIPAQGQATATFTWNGPFANVPASIQVIPVIPLQ